MAISRSVRITRRSVRVGGGLLDRAGLVTTIQGITVSALTSTLTSSAASFTAGGAGVTLTFTARDVDSNLIVGYTPVPESGVV